MTAKIILASASPRRKELLSYIVPEFDVVAANVDETALNNEQPEHLVERLAEMKAKYVSSLQKDAIVIGSDTIVAKEQKILGKPKDYNDFQSMMALLSNGTHKVFTGVCIALGEETWIKTVITEVTMGFIESEDVAHYWQTQEPKDKAGGYAIQGIGGQFIQRINGSMSAVIGLPLFETKHLLNDVLSSKSINRT